MKTLEELCFSNTYARLPASFYQQVAPTPVPNPYLVGFSEEAAKLIELNPQEFQRPEFVEIFAGNRLLSGFEPIAMKYAGHQFGHYVPQLGDGRAILLGQVQTATGAVWDLHLKGGGRTAYSRMGDGRAVLRSSIREFLACEAMASLGIPTTRALCVIGTDMPVYREDIETGALVLRMAPSHIRFGSFEVFAHRGQTYLVKILADYVLQHHYPHLLHEANPYLSLFREVVSRTAKLVAQWQSVGFAHGVLNTDNMSILGITLDYGPYGFVEDFDPRFICNHSDEMGRYSFEQQPYIGQWNLSALGSAMLSLIDREEAIASIREYPEIFNQAIDELMRAKLGLQHSEAEDTSLWQNLLNLLAEQKVDFTNFFRQLGNFQTAEGADNEPLVRMFPQPEPFRAWCQTYRHRLMREGRSDTERKQAMDRVNPKYVLRNYLAQIAIEKAQNKDFSEVKRLLSVLQRPFEEQPEMNHYAQPAPPERRHIVVSCSS